MEIELKKYIENEDDLKHLIKISHGGEPLIHLLKNDKQINTYYAFSDNQLIAAIMTWRNNVHPKNMYLKVLINPLFRNHGTEEMLIDKLINDLSNHSSLQTQIWETDNHLHNLLLEYGFQEIRRTYEPRLDVTLLRNEKMLIPEDYCIMNLSELTMREDLLHKLIKQVKRNYEQTHEVNPAKNISSDYWKKLVFSDDLIQAGSYVLLCNDQRNIIAYSFLHESNNKSELELGWSGSVDLEHKHLVPYLVFNQVKFASDKKFQYITGEFDTTDPFALEVLNNFPFAPSPSLITLIKDVT